MLIKQIRAELIKLRRGRIWAAFFALPLIPAVFGTLNYLGNLELLTSLWDSLWTQHTLFSCYFFSPMLIAVFCACLWQTEYSGANLNQTLTMPVPAVCLLLSKLLLSFLISALMLLWGGLLYILSGILIGLPVSALPSALPLWLAGGLLGSFAICALQLFLAMAFRSFAVPVGIALLGGIWGLMMLSKSWGLFCPYSLISMGMYCNNTARSLAYLPFTASCLCFTLMFFAASLLWVRQVMRG